MSNKLFPYFLLLCALIGGCYFLNHKEDKLFATKELVDYIHQNGINETFKKADTYKYNQDYLKALAAFENTLEKTLNSDEKHYALNQLAYINLTINEDSAAHKWIQVLEKDKGPLSILASADYNYNVGTWAYHTFKPKMSEAYLQKALGGYKGFYGEGHLRVGLCLTELGMMYYEYAETPDSSFGYMNMAISVFQNSPSIKVYSLECELGMAMTKSSKRDYDGVIAHCEIISNLNNTGVFNNIILASRAMSMKGNALRKKAIFEFDEIKKTQLKNQADSLYHTAINNSKKLEHIRIQEFYRDLILSKLRDSVRFFSYLNELKQNLTKHSDIYAKTDRLEGAFHDYNGNYDKAIVFYKKALKNYLEDSLRNRLLFIDVYACLGDIYKEKGLLDSAQYYFMEGIKFGTVYENKPVKLKELMNPNFYQGKPFLFFDFGVLANILLKKYKLNNDLNTLLESYNTFLLTDKLLFPGLISTDENSILVYQTEVAQSVYDGAIECAYLLYQKTRNENYLNQAFKFLEKPKSFLLVKNSETILKENQPNEKTLNEIKNTNFIINKLKWENNQPYKLTRFQQRLDSLNLHLQKNHPKFYSLKVVQPIEELEKIRKQLGEDRVLLELKLTKNKLFIFTSNSNKSNLFVENIDSNFMNQVNEFKQNLIKNNSSYNAVANYQRLGNVIYLKIFGKIPPQYFLKKVVYIIPDGILNEIPFEALVKPSIQSFKSYKYLPYFLFDCAIAYAPSWKILSQNMDYKLPKNPKIVTYKYADNTNELPYSKHEIASINNNWKNVVNRITDNSDNPKSIFMDDLKSFDLAHLSLHAASSSYDKLENKIYFKSNFKEPLYGFELTENTIKTSVIILSACETAKGKTESGEGVYSISRVFIQSGAKRVIASLWKTDDALSSIIFSNFYKNLNDQNNLIKSISESKIQYIKQSDAFKSNPCFWATLRVFD